MRLDLERLRDVHPSLPEEVAAEFALKAALALQRRHAPGVVARVSVGAESQQATLHWNVRKTNDAMQLDYQRVTEGGAEALALSLVHASRGWVVVRRLQRGEHADWLLREPATRKLVALEVSGTDAADGVARMAQKLEQVGRSKVRVRAACVVGFLEPHAALELVPEASR